MYASSCVFGSLELLAEANAEDAMKMGKRVNSRCLVVYTSLSSVFFGNVCSLVAST